MNILSDLVSYVKHPVLEEDENKDFQYRVGVFFTLLFTCFIISFFISIIIGMIYNSGLIENDYHAFDDLYEELNNFQLFFAAAFIAPLIEETIFRAPLTLFRSPWKIYKKVEGQEERISQEIHIKAFENPNVFRFAFYGLAITFGYVHLSNYEIDTQILLFSPILVAPQIILGLIFGYIRVRFGFIWAIAMHAFYNGILVIIALSAQHAVQ